LAGGNFLLASDDSFASTLALSQKTFSKFSSALPGENFGVLSFLSS
jgi:hypothetical protein